MSLPPTLTVDRWTYVEVLKFVIIPRRASISHRRRRGLSPYLSLPAYADWIENAERRDRSMPGSGWASPSERQVYNACDRQQQTNLVPGR
jgi:hypothetical protein